MGGSGGKPNSGSTLIPSPMALNLTFPDLSNVESTDHEAENNNFVGCKAVFNYSAENNTSRGQPASCTQNFHFLTACVRAILVKCYIRTEWRPFMHKMHFFALHHADSVARSSSLSPLSAASATFEFPLLHSPGFTTASPHR